MVMKRNVMGKNLTQSILKSIGRYIAIAAIIALGAAMFVGLRMTKQDMLATGQTYADEQNMFDLRLISSYGWSMDQVDQVAQIDGVTEAEGVFYTDVIASADSGADAVYRFYALPEKINQPLLLGGRMPQAPNECLADGFRVDDSIIGTQVHISAANEDSALDTMRYDTYTVVGYMGSPLYMDMNRGNTTIGSGTIANYYYVPMDGLQTDHYTEIHITIPGDYAIYSDAYNDAMDDMASYLEPILEPLGMDRLNEVKLEAVEAYAQGVQEYKEGLREFEEGKREALQELEDAYQQLLDAEDEITNAEQQLIAGQAQLDEARATLAEGEAALKEGWESYHSSMETLYAPLDTAQSALEEEYAALTSQIQQLDSQIAAIDDEIARLDAQMGDQGSELASLTGEILQLDTQIAALQIRVQGLEAALEIAQRFPDINASVIEQLQAELQPMYTELSGLISQRDALVARQEVLEAALSAPLAQQAQLRLEKTGLEGERSILRSSLNTVELGLQGIQEGRELLDEQMAAALAELEAGEEQLAEGRAQIDQAHRQLAEGRAALEEGKKELEEGWKEYESGKTEAELQISRAEAELSDGKRQLEDARQMLESMTENPLYVLDRNTNVGYSSLDSSSDIVAGVSRVFPVFFLLIAALVCITTMTRMVDEERTQIGTLKALGYSNAAIISKYLIYAGSSAIIGCGLGVLLGSVVFPKILWQAYKIMLFIPYDMVLVFDWTLCLIVVAAYTAAMLLVTWYCCRRTLKEVPAELIRPKSPEAGKKILLEFMPFWSKISFLNKVTIRNIFRYRQRFAMMMVGIGGCTALLLTGFGLRDSIVNIVDFQFEDITVYDMSVYFAEGQTAEQQEAFREKMAPYSEDILFYHQISAEMEFENQVREIYMIAAEDGVTDFIDFHKAEESLPMPGKNELMLSVGAAEAMGIQVGDTVLLRNADMQTLEVTVSGIYDNYVQNYCILTPQTIEGQWGSQPQMQMAFVTVMEGKDVHEASAAATAFENVMNVSVSEDLAEMVGNMMEALDLVVITVVICAGLLAAIVLYNLTNINITERIREIATIKVLGFRAGETAMYVFKENLSLSAIGAILGLGGGVLLLKFVMSQIKIDFVWFEPRILLPSYLFAVVLTMFCACVIDYVFYFKLDKINMAEALKSVE